MKTKKKLIFAIETSCDDTSIAILKGNPDQLTQLPELLAHNSFSQEIILKRWGGVVPEIAARNHVLKITPLLEQSFEETNLSPTDIDLIAVTTHPGLLGPLLTGITAAKTLALLYHLPISPVNHLYAHLEAIHLTESVTYPYLGVLVSGGHSIYFFVTSPNDFKIIGTSIDDAAGEAFDKGGKLMGLGYPAGKIIDDMSLIGNDKKYTFPVSMLDSGDANLSFSGVKTALRNFMEKEENKNCNLNDVCASYQYAIVTALLKKCRIAKSIIGIQDIPIVVGGGVACNSFLRRTFLKEFHDVHFVAPQFCTDNGAMVANYALRTFNNAISFPACLSSIDARGNFLQKTKGAKK
jgi:N6-L-threonylcarbamoyladenine synthase